jgi:arylsulfatase A-like enzyme
MDCDDGDPEVNPEAIEFVGNGKDDNCAGGDLATWAPQADGTDAPGAPRRSVVLVTVDALRADMVVPGQMDELVAFAAAGALFSRAYSAACFTDYAMRSLMTGRYPMDFTNGDFVFGQEPSLAERLAAAGYATEAIHAIYSINPYVLQGFAAVDGELAEQNREFRGQTSVATADRAIAAFERLRAGGRPFFLWVHYFDPHSDYLPVAGAKDFGPGAPGRYRQEVWATDREVGRFLRVVEGSGFLGDNLVAFTADHGELLGERGRFGHAFWLDEPVLRVPLVLRGAGIPAGRFDSRVRLVDVFPTLLAFAAGLAPASDGRSLAPVMEGREREDRDAFAVGQYADSFVRVALVGPWKLVQDLEQSSESLYRVADDPDETRDRIDDAPDEAARLRAALGARWDRSLNDLAVARKLRLLDRRKLDPAQYRAWQRQSYELNCKRGFADSCEKLKLLDGGR